MELAEFSLSIGLAAVAGLFIGIEREFTGKSAGLKTNALVALGACVFILLSLQFQGEDFVDITRVIGQVVTGIGFIGAGTILQHGKNVKGLTTAATIWCSAAAGGLAALQMYAELLIICIIIVVINLLFGFLEKKLIRGKRKQEDNKD
ncbi:MgtC/SapB family protein [Salegentibacter salegens]|uniref:Putative Mg2+ transporter-C (MgtC) family protein n=1 Tax=Salegentibacter salegens TaxID=143223 RepID=A0A1M7MSN4_9FLAO|nr:MgtC/SapB family protein [Salegentibacter salegens]PRX52539.1 putative Mg2+ transporter-C (MgtC) family protein [Salegentibacter salegens]SHM94068.1 putative Mg2+ transporter-C (MgtC) family protein [Salegentibacter salegens]